MAAPVGVCAVISAVIAALAFLLPSWCAPLIFIFLLPLFFVFFRVDHGAAGALFFLRQGLLWGLVFFGLTLAGLVVMLHERAQGSLRHVAYLILVAYLSCYAGIWFVALHTAMKQVQRWTVRCLLMAAITVLFFLFLERCGLFIVGQCLGYPLAWPLLPLMEYPALLALLPSVGGSFLLFCLVIGSAGISYSFSARTWRGALLLLAWLPLLAGGLFSRKDHYRGRQSGVAHLTSVEITEMSERCLPTTTPAILGVSQVGYVCPPQGEHDYPFDVGQEITHALVSLRERNPHLSLIIMPESSCKYALNEYPSIIKQWFDAALFDDCALLIGSHRRHNNQLFNSLYYLDKRLIIKHYDKQKRLPFCEYLPRSADIPLFRQLFLDNKKEFTAGTQRTVFEIANPHFFCTPCICSEFYLDPVRADAGEGHLPLLVVSNDSWFARTPYLQHLFLLLARYRALETQRAIIYCVHSGAWWLTPHEQIPLKS